MAGARWARAGFALLKAASIRGVEFPPLMSLLIHGYLLARVKFAPVPCEVARYCFLWDTVAGFPRWLVVAVPRDFELEVTVLQFAVTEYLAEGI